MTPKSTLFKLSFLVEIGTKFVSASACFLLACFVGYIFLTFKIDDPGSLMSPDMAVIFYTIVVFASPFWLLTFFPPYLCISSKSLFWKWYLAPVLGALIGFLISLIVFGPANADTLCLLYLMPPVVGFSLFLFGAISKKYCNPVRLIKTDTGGLKTGDK